MWKVALSLLGRYWKPAGVVLVVVAMLGFHYFAVLQAGRSGAQKGRAEVQAKLDAALQREATLREHDKAVRTYRLEIGRGADLQPLGTVRLCPPTLVTLEGTPAGGAGEGTPGARSVQPVPEGSDGVRDVGPALDALLREADEVSARLRAIQQLH